MEWWPGSFIYTHAVSLEGCMLHVHRLIGRRIAILLSNFFFFVNSKKQREEEIQSSPDKIPITTTFTFTGLLDSSQLSQKHSFMISP